MHRTIVPAAVYATMIFSSNTVNAFMPHLDNPSFTGCSQNVIKSRNPSILHLHPDQAKELEKAAAEMMDEMKATGDIDQEPVETPVDDTTISSTHSSSAAISMSQSSLQNPRKWWSMAFTELIRGN
uniref:Uncharacterized protein n=1 Tax=Eucampia antarctica TaxID=49252 RepID=A0A7S2VYM8_9STRA